MEVPLQKQATSWDVGVVLSILLYIPTFTTSLAQLFLIKLMWGCLPRRWLGIKNKISKERRQTFPKSTLVSRKRRSDGTEAVSVPYIVYIVDLQLMFRFEHEFCSSGALLLIIEDGSSGRITGQPDVPPGLRKSYCSHPQGSDGPGHNSYDSIDLRSPLS